MQENGYYKARVTGETTSDLTTQQVDVLFHIDAGPQAHIGVVTVTGTSNLSSAQVQRIADITGAGVAKALLGKDALSDDLPYVTGSIGLLGTRPSYQLMRDCDTLLIVGSNFPYSQFLPKYDAARAVQIDIDGSAIGMRYPTELSIIADAALLSIKLVKHGTLKVYPGLPHGMCTTHPETINPDLLAFIKG